MKEQFAAPGEIIFPTGSRRTACSYSRTAATGSLERSSRSPDKRWAAAASAPVFAEEAGATLDFSASVSLASASLVRVVASEPCKPRLDQSVMPAMTKLGWSENSRELGE